MHDLYLQPGIFISGMLLPIRPLIILPGRIWLYNHEYGHAVPPSVPSNFEITNSGDPSASPILDWDDNPESDISYYKVYRNEYESSGSGSTGYIHIGSPTTSDYYDLQCEIDLSNPPHQIYYRVTAVDDNGQESSRTGPEYVGGEYLY